MILKTIGILALSVFISATANASVIFQDNFDDEGTAGVSVLNYNSFANWTVSGGTVDLISDPNDWLIDCVGGTGKCVDLDGSTGNAGILSSNNFTLSAGTYTVMFDISGNQRNGNTDEMLVTLGGFLDETFTVLGGDPWKTITRSFTVTSDTTSFISFNHSGTDNIGIILDNVSVVSAPSAIALLGLGLFGLGVVGRRRKA
jgi:hypothetical protein